MKLKLVRKKVESPGVKSLIFKPEQPLSWKAGQFLHYVLNHSKTDDRGSDRWFTISSAPFEKQVMITTRFAGAKGSTFKKALETLKAGDIIECSDLDGDFVLAGAREDYVFIAGGIGITPFRAILKQAEHEGKLLRVRLLYANRKHVAAFKKEFDAMAGKNPHLKIHYLFHPVRFDINTIRELVPDVKKPFFMSRAPSPWSRKSAKLWPGLAFQKNASNRIGFPAIPQIERPHPF